MRCLGCKAWKDGKCLAGVTPYRSKNKTDGIGCACNTRTVEKLLRQNRKTNADRVRAMSDEELARWITDELIEPGYCDDEHTYELWLDWLREEVKDDNYS